MARKKTKKRPVIERDDVETRATLKRDDETEDYDDADSSPAHVPNGEDASRVAFARAAPSSKGADTSRVARDAANDGAASPSRVEGEGPVKLCVTVRPQFVLDDDEASMRIDILEEVVEDLKLELDGYRAAARELATEIEAKDRALEASARETRHEKTEGRAQAVREATARLSDRLEKAEKAVERERGDGDRGRKALEKLKKMEAELERRMCDQDEAFELKWAQRVAEANADRDAFRGKLAKLEGEMETVKISEERARSELTLAKRQIDELQLRLARAPIAPAPRGDERTSDRRDVVDDDASKPRRGFFSFITGVPEEPYAPKSASPVVDA